MFIEGSCGIIQYLNIYVVETEFWIIKERWRNNGER